jgi:hypothetical protein
LEILERRVRSRERMRNWVRERSVWRMGRIRFIVEGGGLWVFNWAGSEDEAARSSMFSIWEGG